MPSAPYRTALSESDDITIRTQKAIAILVNFWDWYYAFIQHHNFCRPHGDSRRIGETYPSLAGFLFRLLVGMFKLEALTILIKNVHTRRIK